MAEFLTFLSIVMIIVGVICFYVGKGMIEGDNDWGTLLLLGGIALGIGGVILFAHSTFNANHINQAFIMLLNM